MIAAVVALPVVSVVLSVFSGAGDTWRHLAATALPRYVGNTALLLALVTFGVVSIGVVSAGSSPPTGSRGAMYSSGRCFCRSPCRLTSWRTPTPTGCSSPARCSALRSLTGWRARGTGFPKCVLPGAAVMLSFALYPYVYLVARTAFLDLSRSAIEAARLAGYGPLGAFGRVAVPLARPAIAAGSALALMETLADFGTVSYFGIEVFTTGIFKAWLSMGDSVAAAQLSACLLGFVVLLLALERVNRGRAAYHGPAPRRSRPHQLHGAASAAAFIACAAPVVFGFALPAVLLGRLAWEESIPAARLGVLAGNSFSIAALTAFIAAAAALVMAYAARLTRSRLVAMANRMAGLGYAVPGAVIAVGVLVPLGRLDNALAGWLEQAFGMKPGLLLTGTIAALVYAYLVRLLAVSLQTTNAGLAKITPSMEDAARSLGAAPAATLARVHVPLLAPSLATAALLVFVDVLKELPATFALRPFNFDTLAVEAYNLAKDERLAEAAAPSLALVAAGLLPVIYVSKRYFQATRS